MHPPPPAPSGPKFLTQKIVADPKMRCHQKSFGIWRVTETILGKKNVFFFKKHILEKIHNKSYYFLIFRFAFRRYQYCNSEKPKISPKMCLYVPGKRRISLNLCSTDQLTVDWYWYCNCLLDI